MTTPRDTLTLEEARQRGALKPAEAFTLLGLSKNSGWRAIYDGTIPSVRLGPKTIRIPVPELLRLLGEDDP